MTLKKSFIPLLVVLLVFSTRFSMAQNTTIEKVKLVLEVGNAHELSQYVYDKVDLNIDGEAGTYSNSQAEGVLKNFFKLNPPKSFQVNHEGTSQNGLVYAIGEYQTGESSYRVWIRLKKINDHFMIHEMSFVKE